MLNSNVPTNNPAEGAEVIVKGIMERGKDTLEACSLHRDHTMFPFSLGDPEAHNVGTRIAILVRRSECATGSHRRLQTPLLVRDVTPREVGIPTLLSTGGKTPPPPSGQLADSLGKQPQRVLAPRTSRNGTRIIRDETDPAPSSVQTSDLVTRGTGDIETSPHRLQGRHKFTKTTGPLVLARYSCVTSYTH
jgi:hypothetical protein